MVLNRCSPGCGNGMPGNTAVRQQAGCGDEDETIERDANQQAIRISAVIEHMLRHLKEPLRISELSAVAGISSSHFFFVFKDSTGFSPIDFFIRLRMCYAGELLRNRSLSIKETAVLLGYHDQFYFSRVFKSVTGAAPRAYRKMILGDGEDPISQGSNSERRADQPPAGFESLVFKTFERRVPAQNRLPIGAIAKRIQFFHVGDESFRASSRFSFCADPSTPNDLRL